MSEARLARLRARLPALKVEAMLVSRAENRRWLSGFTAHDASPTAHAGWLLVTADQAVLVTYFNYHGQAVAEVDGAEVVLVPPDQRFHETAAEQIKRLGARVVGFEANGFAVQTHRDLRKALGSATRLKPLGAAVDPLRAVKDADELTLIRAAIALADQAMEGLFSELKPGMTEAEAAWWLEAFMRSRGAEGMAFDPGVAAGPNGAVPHHKPGRRAIRPGEPIWVDIGARWQGYCSDITRTVLLGRPDDQYTRLWASVLEAQRRALDTIRPGMTGKACDATARDHLIAAGLGDQFGHGLGHGVGLEIHEEPRLSRFTVRDQVAAGMVTSVEPGVYIPGWGGVRHEDLVLLTADGLEVLTRASKPPTL